jgi:mannosyltransferase OCH1-like enzyme
MIPRTIHYCWFGPNSKSALNERCLESWRRHLSDYEIKEWNETNSPLDNVYCRASHARGLWSRVANYVRLHALYTEGGIYLDTDVEVLKSFTPLLHHKCFLGFQQKEELSDWVNNAIAGAQAGHSLLRRCMELTVEAFTEAGEFSRSPTIMTRALREMGLREYGLQEIKDVAVYPAEYFYPYPWFGKFSPDCIKEETYCVHYWEGSWVKKRSRAMALPRLLKKMARNLASTLIQSKSAGNPSKRDTN